MIRQGIVLAKYYCTLRNIENYTYHILRILTGSKRACMTSQIVRYATKFTKASKYDARLLIVSFNSLEPS